MRESKKMPTGKVLSQDAVDMIRYMHDIHKLTYAKIGLLIGRPKGYIGRIIESIDPVTGIRKLQKKGRHVKMTDEQRLRDLALANPFIGCEALTVLYNEGADLKLSKSSVHRRLKEAGVEVTKVPATTEDVQDKKTFPKSQTIWKFVAVPEKKKRRVTKRKPKSEAELDGAAPESSGVVDFNQMLNQQVVSMPEALPEAEQDLQLPVHTINILIDPSLGIPEIYAYNKMAGV